ncbi:hypothetical protein AAVH_20713 [Aphelenchoides avenae]|nr:hypothetical protein AAVH_20713 [Aphelenchus avenae]
MSVSVDPKDLRNNADLGLAECVVVEPLVLRLFAQGTGLLDALANADTKDFFIQNCMYGWALHEMVINTVRNKGHLTNTIHTTFEDSIIPNSRQAAVEFYKAHDVKNIDVAVEALMERSETFLNTCRLFVNLRFNDAEQAVLAQIGLLQCGSVSV